MPNLDDFNGVRSTIIDQGTPPAGIAVSRNSTFIFGTASRGPRHTPIRPTSENVQELFGSVPLDASFDTSLVRGFYEYTNSCIGKADVALIRIGNVSKSRIDLYENVAYLSGDLTYSLTSEGVPAYAMYIEAVPDGAEYNDTKVTVSEDANGNPSHMKIELPDGYSIGYNLSPNASAPGVVTKVSDLVNLINANSNFTNKIIAGYNPLIKDITISLASVSGEVVTSYNLTPSGTVTNESWGDKLIAIDAAYQQREVSQMLDVGELTATLTVLPDKSIELGANDTLSQFVRVSDMESILVVTPVFAGQTNVTRNLYCKSVLGWDNTYAISGNETHGWAFKLYTKRNGSSSYVEITNSNETTDGDKFTLNTSTGTVLIKETLSLGDTYYASYRYEVSYAEAKLRSSLLDGSDRSYFIAGHQITFGAEQPANLYVYYTTKVYFEKSDIQITDRQTATIEFSNGANLPVLGLPVILTLRYEPELPAASGRVLPGSVVQPGALSGGNDGRNMSQAEYIEAIKDAMVAVDLYPRRHNVIMGMYLDDVGTGYNEETGMPEEQAISMHSYVLPYIDRTSNLANECDVEVPIRPLASLDQASINTWVDRLTVSSDSDLSRPANLIDGINNFRAECPVGVFITAISEVNSGRKYFMNPACLYAAYKQNMGFDKSATHDFLPGNVQDLGVKIFNAETISRLNAKRYTAAIVDYGGRFIWADAPTLALKGRSQFDRQFVRDTVYLAVGMAREVAEKYIGKPRLPQYLVAMKKDVSKALNMLVPSVLSDLFVDIIPVQDGHITGKTKLRLMLITAKEIRQVDIETSISLAE